MDENTINSILEKINNKVQNSQESVKEDEFIKINPEISDKKIVFIDGGNTEIIKSADFSLQFIRTAAITFQNNKKVNSRINEFMILVSAESKDTKIQFKTEIFPIKGDAISSIEFDSMDESIRIGYERADISVIAGIARRFAELELAKSMIDELEINDIIVLDGSLKSIVKGEREIIKKLSNKGLEKGVMISSLAKTSRAFSEKGDNIARKAASSGSELEYPWYYQLDEKEYAASIVRLNKNSNYVFEFNIINPQKEKVNEVLSLLAANSTDLVFPGYPYGLILVDRFARVTNQEKEYFLIRFQSIAGDKWKNIKIAENILNSHSILDNIS